MQYSFAKTVPANTSEVNSIKTTFPIAKGVIHQVGILFPPGVSALTHVRILRFNSPIFPSRTGQDFTGDGETVPLTTFYEIIERPYEVEIETWNDDTVHAHTIRVRMGVLPRELVNPLLFFEAISGDLKLVLRRIGIAIP